MPDRQWVAPFGDKAAPADWLLPAALEFMPKLVHAKFDGSGSTSSYKPCLRLISDSGHVACEAVSTVAVAAGASADVSWFPGVVTALSAGAVAVVGARIEAHAIQNVPSSTDTDLTYDTVAFDTAGMANLGADARKLTVTTAGLYMVTCERAWPYQSAARRQISIQHNGFTSGGAVNVCDDSRAAIWATPIGGAGETTCLATTLIEASAGDFFATGANQDSGVALTTGGGVAEFFSAILLGTI